MDTIPFITIHGATIDIDRSKIEFRPSVYGIVLHEDMILLTNTRSTGKYFLPGGSIEIGEFVEDALRRELREEAGIEIDVVKLLAHDENFFYYEPRDKAWQVIGLIFLCKPKSLELSDAANEVGDEAEKPRWVKISSLTNDCFQVFGRTILNVLRSL